MSHWLRSRWPELALVLSGFALRLYDLGAQGLWWDEAFSVQLASHDWNTFWTLLAEDRSPPLFHLLLRGWGSMAGWSEFGSRYLSLFFGVLLLPLTYQFAQRMAGRRAGLIAMLLTTTSPALVAYSQETRMYTLLVAATAGFLLAVEHYLAPAGRGEFVAAGWATLLLSEIALLFSHYYGAAIALAANLVVLAEHILQRRPAARLREWMAAQIAASALLVAWLAAMLGHQLRVRGATERAPDGGSFLHQVLILWAAGVRDLDHRQAMLGVLAWIWLVLTVTILALTLWRRPGWGLVARWGAFTFLALGLAFGLAVWQVSFHPRYTLPLLVPLIALCAVALAVPKSSWAWKAILVPLVVTTWLVGWGVAKEPAYAKDDGRGVADYLQANTRPGDAIWVEHNDYTTAYYYPGPARIEMIAPSADTETMRQLSAASPGAQDIWTVHWHVSQQDARGLWPYTLERAGKLLERKFFRGYTVSHYQQEAPLAEPTWRPAALRFGTVELIGLDLPPQVEGGDGLALALKWRALAPTQVPLKAVVALWDRSRQRWTSSDVALLDVLGRTSDAWISDEPNAQYVVLPIPAGLPPAEYPVTIGVYEGDTLRRVQTPQGAEDELLGYVQVQRSSRPDADPYAVLANLGLRSPQEPLDAAGLLLEGIAVWPAQPAPAQPIQVTLRWRATKAGLPTYRPIVQLSSSRVWTEHGQPLFEPDYPTILWHAGETILDRRSLIYPPRREPLALGVRLGDRSATAVILSADLSQLSFEPPAAAQPVQAHFGNFAELIGYRLSGDRLEAGQLLTLTLYWRATNVDPIPTHYTVFAQALAPNGHLVAQHDGPPHFNQRPTPAWVPDEVIADPHPLAIIDPNYHGSATLIVGLYDSSTLLRVPLWGGGDAFRLPTLITVGAP